MQWGVHKVRQDQALYPIYILLGPRSNKHITCNKDYKQDETWQIQQEQQQPAITQQKQQYHHHQQQQQ